MLHNLPLKYTLCVIIRHVIGSVGNIKIGTEVVHTMTRTPLSRSKGQGHQAALLTAVLARQAAAVVGVRTCWPWKIAATLPSAWRAKRFGAWGGEGRGHTVAAVRLQLVWFACICLELKVVRLTVTVFLI